jgi:hypothetical protein
MKKSTKILLGVAGALALSGIVFLIFGGKKKNNTANTDITPSKKMLESGTFIMNDWNDDGGYVYKYSDGTMDYFQSWGEYVFTTDKSGNYSLITPAPVTSEGRYLAVKSVPCEYNSSIGECRETGD